MIFSTKLGNIDFNFLKSRKNKLDLVLNDANFFKSNSPEYIKAFLSSNSKPDLILNYARCLMHKYVFPKSHNHSFLVIENPNLDEMVYDYFFDKIITSELLPLGHYINTLLGLTEDDEDFYDINASLYDIYNDETLNDNQNLKDELFDIVEFHLPQEITFYSISSTAIDKYIANNKVDIYNFDNELFTSESSTFFCLIYILYLCNTTTFLKSIEFMKIVKSTHPDYEYELILACNNENSILDSPFAYIDQELIPKLNELKDFLCNN